MRDIYRINKNLSIEHIIEDIPKPSGIILSPDQQTLYVASFADNDLPTIGESVLEKQVPHGVMTYDLNE